MAPSAHLTPPSTLRATAAPFGPVPTATHAAGVAHAAPVATASAAGSIPRCCHAAPLSVVAKTAVDVVLVTRARHRPGPGQLIAATPVPGGCDAVTAATFRAGLTIRTTDPDGPAPPRRHPDAQHPALEIVTPVSAGVAAGAHRPRPPAVTSTDAARVAALGFAPAATHHASGSHASAESVTDGTVAAYPTPSGGGAGVVPQPTRTTPASTPATAIRAITARMVFAWTGRSLGLPSGR